MWKMVEAWLKRFAALMDNRYSRIEDTELLYGLFAAMRAVRSSFRQRWGQ